MRLQTFGSLAAVAVTLAMGGASPGRAQSAPATPGASTQTSENAPGRGTGMMAGMCPMEVPGTQVTANDVKGGAALSFTTKTGNVEELRRRVQHMAQMHNQMHGQGGMMTGGRGGSASAGAEQGGCCQGMMESGGVRMPAATASAEDIPGGARMVFRPKDPSQLDALSQSVRLHAERMASGQCPMMAPRPSSGSSDQNPKGPTR